MIPADSVFPIVDSTCAGCGRCVARCPTGVLALDAGKAWLARPDCCNYCAECQDVCPRGAIALPYIVVFEEASPG